MLPRQKQNLLRNFNVTSKKRRLGGFTCYSVSSLFYELMRTLSISIRNWSVRWAYESITGACTEHTRQELMHAVSAVPSKHAENMHQELMHTLCIRVRNWCVCSAHMSGTGHNVSMCISFYPYTQHKHKNLNLKRSLQNMLIIHIRNCWVHWVCASGTDVCTDYVSGSDAHGELIVAESWAFWYGPVSLYRATF